MDNNELLDFAKAIIHQYELGEEKKMAECMHKLRLELGKDPVAKLQCSGGLVLLPVDEDIAAAPIANALLSTGRFTTEECSDLAEGLLMFINDHDLVVAKKN